MFDSWQSIVALIGAILGAYGVVLWLGIIVWTYRDISERTRDTWSHSVAVVLVAIFNIPGLFLYLILRPNETLADVYERKLETEAIKQEMAEQRRSCPTCQRLVKDEFLICPHCRTSLREPCPSCDRALELNWTACPYCGVQGPQATVTVTSSLAAPPALAPDQPIAGLPEPIPQPEPDETPKASTTKRSSRKRKRSSDGTPEDKPDTSAAPATSAGSASSSSSQTGSPP